MPVETLKDAFSAGWRGHARCLGDEAEYGHLTAKRRYQAELSLGTLVWTRGRNMPGEASDLSGLPRPSSSRPHATSPPPNNRRRLEHQIDAAVTYRQTGD